MIDIVEPFRQVCTDLGYNFVYSTVEGLNLKSIEDTDTSFWLLLMSNRAQRKTYHITGAPINADIDAEFELLLKAPLDLHIGGETGTDDFSEGKYAKYVFPCLSELFFSSANPNSQRGPFLTKLDCDFGLVTTSIETTDVYDLYGSNMTGVRVKCNLKKHQ